MVEGRGMKVAEKTLYWWSVHLERFLKFCRSAGAESIEIPRGGGKVVFGVISSRRFGAGICAGAGADGFGCIYWGNGGVVVGRRSVWAGGAEIPVEDEFGRADHRGHRGTERVLAKDRVHGMESPGESDGSASHPRISLGVATPRAERNQESVGCARGRA